MDSKKASEDLSILFDSLRSKAEHGDPQTKLQILQFAQELTTTAESRQECMHRIGFAALQPCVAVVGCDKGVFQHIASCKAPVKAADISEALGLETNLLNRLLRSMAAYRMLSETQPGQYTANNVTRTLALPYAEGSLKHLVYNVQPAFVALNEWLSKHPSGLTTSVTQANDLPYQLAFNTKEPYFNDNSHREGGLAAQWMTTYMQCLTDESLTWYDVYQVQDQTANMSPNQYLWVDVGGGFGHRTQEFRSKFPSLPGKLIVQDLPHIVATIQPQESIELMGHDFFTPQPVVGAKFYYLRYVLHDWPDEDCVRILVHLRNAMETNSVILVDEILVPELGAYHFVTELDFAMLCLFGSRERTLTEFKEIFDRSGLELLSVGTYKPTNGMSVMALEKKAD